MAVTAQFTPGTGTLTEFGDNLDNNIVTSRDAAGNILVNGGAVNVIGGKPTVANTSLIQVFGQGGDDIITLSEVNGALPAANLFGGCRQRHHHRAVPGATCCSAEPATTRCSARAATTCCSAAPATTCSPAATATTRCSARAGNDRMIWNPGDDNDLMEGGDGIDTAEVNGGNGSEIFTISANGSRVRFDRVSPAPFFLDIGTTENLVLNANGGDDIISASGNLSTLIQLTIDGGAGNDSIPGGNGADLLIGGDGNDFIDGQQGNDTILMGDGDDIFQWDPGDGSDLVEGGIGADTMVFNGANIAETFDISANGGRTRFTRNVGSVVMDVNDVERIQVNALGGADAITVNDLTGTDVVQVDVSLGSTIGGATGDGAADTVTVKGTNGGDHIDVVGSGTSAAVVGLPAVVSITGAEGANDTLVVNGGGGDDLISATGLPTGVMKLTIDGGTGADTILGSQGADFLLGGDGDDVVLGGRGDDVAFLGAGNDLFQWNPGDGSDIRGGPGRHRQAAVQRRQHRREHRHLRQRRRACASPATSPPSRWT
jgi:Ca2+-binding RTX toxin-like protein